MLEYEDYEKHLAIHKYQLDDDIEDQANLFFEVAQRASEAMALRDGAKTELEEIEARLYLTIREDETNAGRKVTEAMLSHMVSLSSPYTKKKEAFDAAKHEVDRWNVLKEAFVQRGFMLKEMAGLYVAGYFAEFSVKGDKNTEEVKVDSLRDKSANSRRQRGEIKTRRRVE